MLNLTKTVSMLFLTVILATAVFAENKETSAHLTPGLDVIAGQTPLIASSPVGEDIIIDKNVLSDFICSDIEAVTVSTLPAAECGTLYCGTLPLKAGDSVKCTEAEVITYRPSNEENGVFSIITDSGYTVECIMKQYTGSNEKPVCGKMIPRTVTGVDLSVSSYLRGKDPDGDSMSFEVITPPEKGILTVNDRSTGQYVYVPYCGNAGTDTFSYRICDEFGHYSDVFSADIMIRSGDIKVFDDMKNSDSAYAAYTAVKDGITDTEFSGNTECFCPESNLSKIDFLVMAMKTFGAQNVKEVPDTAFDDDNELTANEKGYLALAQKCGIITGKMENGLFLFSPDEEISGGDAAMIVANILGYSDGEAISVSVKAGDAYDRKSWAVNILAEEGIVNSNEIKPDETVTKETAAKILSRIGDMLV